MIRRAALLLVAAWLSTPGAAAAGPSFDAAEFAFRPHPGAVLPLSASLRDEAGHAVRLGEFFGRRPVILVFEYLRCTALCGVTVEQIIAALDALPLAAAKDFQFVAISIDPRDSPADAAAAKAKYLASYHRSGGAAGMHFLTGAEPAVRQIADRVGFPYRYDGQLDQYLHPAGFVVVSPDGAVSRYFLGVTVSPAELRDGLADAAQGRSLGPLTRLLLLCHIEGAPLGRLTVPVLAALALANLAAGSVLFAVFCRIRRRRHG